MINWHEYWNVIALLMMKYMAQIVYSRGPPFDAVVEQKRLQMYEDKSRFHFFKETYNLPEAITRIIFEYNDEYHEEILSESVTTQLICICYQRPNYKRISLEDVEMI